LVDVYPNVESFIVKLTEWKNKNLRVVFTNGCFDILHRGHVEYLQKARSFGDVLIVGLNSDDSVKRLKGSSRPFMNENDRGFILANLKSVDAVVIFNEETPYEIINQIIPDVLVKGGDYKINEIVGRNTVEGHGGKVVTVKLIEGKSSSLLIDRIKKSK
jgi:rfaE bifunctional protein nucleotidyltransferase chain/domain